MCADVEAELVECTGESNHLHLLINSLRGVSSRRLRQEFPDLVRHYWRAQRLRSGSYLAGSVGGAPLSIVRQYIEQQNRPGPGHRLGLPRAGLHHRPERRTGLVRYPGAASRQDAAPAARDVGQRM